MGSNTASTSLVRAVQQLFCYTRILEVFWTDERLRFTTEIFHQYNEIPAWQVHTQTPSDQWQGKVYSKGHEKLIRSAWTGQRIDKDKLLVSVVHSSSIATPHPTEMV